MGNLRQLAGQTATYGLSSIIGRLLNYLLVPLYTNIFTTGQYGVVTELYAYLSFLIIILTYGMETGFFRFSESESGNPKVYSTALISLFVSSLAFIALAVIFSQPVAVMFNYDNHPEYIVWLGLIIGLDAMAAIPFAWLRRKNLALRFVYIKLVNIATNIIFNLFFLLLCPYLSGKGFSIPGWIYNPEIGVGYVFISNLISSAVTILLLIPSLPVKWNFDKKLWRQMFAYSFPLLLAGLAGMINETFDRAMLKRLLPDSSTAMEQLGIYGANYKIAVLMTIFIQTFRFAAEPFFFEKAKEKNAKEMYADIMKYFIISGLLIFLGVMLYIDFVKYFIGEEFRSGLKIVPVLLAANLFLGIYYNLSIWFKLTNKTWAGASLAFLGAFITVLFNLLLIPVLGYAGSAWTTLICYFVMTVVSFIWGNRHYKINYPLGKIFVYITIAAAIFLLSLLNPFNTITHGIFFNTILLLAFIFSVYFMEPSLRQIFEKSHGKKP